MDPDSGKLSLYLQEDNRFSILVSTLFIVDLMDVRDSQPARVVRFYWRIQFTRYSTSRARLCGCTRDR